MFDVVAGKYRINRRIAHLRHIEHRSNDVGLHTSIDIQTQFSPLWRVEAACGSVFPIWAAADMEKGWHDCLGRFGKDLLETWRTVAHY